tara:strand:+ start:898 stop:2289 length:1392 start_codon:yes stop_codon:yes gene_type:complete
MKRLVLITAPVTSRSGYGDHARDLVRSLIAHDKYDLKIMDVPWGACPRNALDKNVQRDKIILDLILKEPSVPRQPDVYIDIRIPNEFQQVGKFNIGITAGIETNAVSQNWLESCNKMDLIIVPSEHSKAGFVSTVFDKVQPGPDGKQEVVGQCKLEKPIEVLFEGVDEDIYKPLNSDEINSDFFNWLNDEVPEKFAFLSVGQWGKGGYGEDRKDLGKMVKVFCESFANKKKQPALILKTNGATYSIIDREECLDKIKQVKRMFPKDWKLPNVYLLHGDLSLEDMNYLYNHPKIKSLVSFTHGEGFGRPLLEATMTGLHVIATGWSGQVDFLTPEHAMMLPGKIDKVPKSQHWKDIIIPESAWFYVDEDAGYKAYNHSFENREEIKRHGKILMERNRKDFTLNAMTKKFDEIMEKHLKGLPQQVGLQLPKLKKVSDPPSNSKPSTPPTIKLPKLKKVNTEEAQV